MMLICVLVLVLWPAGAAAEDDPMWRLANTFNMGDIYNTGECVYLCVCVFAIVKLLQGVIDILSCFRSLSANCYMCTVPVCHWMLLCCYDCRIVNCP